MHVYVYVYVYVCVCVCVCVGGVRVISEFANDLHGPCQINNATSLMSLY